ncbi:MAG: class I SAM-dependent methyltransferase [Myxococcales bacterium]|nr:class I SAM-dependent methyltransferase [Myxococcales bacterium]MCB9531115.1 class I SAM-dependent methyltransferase [Myxococcales bacterium]MCB9533025.1 class I SAM-dependent methyltransferase [Myxococcales bacterium]
MSGRVTRENFEAWNEEMVREFDPGEYHDHPSPVVRAVERMRVSRIIALLQATPTSRVLEVGCGAGNILERIADAELHGVDISDYILEKARVRLGARATLLKADGEHLPYPDAHFDRVYCSEVLEHVLDPAAVVREMRRVLKPNGIAVVSVPNEATINQAKRLLFRTGPLGRLILRSGEGGYEAVENMQDHWHLHEFDERMLRQVCEPVFSVGKVEGIPLPAPAALRLVAQLRPR